MGGTVIEVVERRRRWSTEKKLEVLIDALEPGASITAVADRHGVSRNLVYTWLRLSREGRLRGLSLERGAAATFAPVEIVGGSPAPRLSAAPVSLAPAHVPEPSARFAAPARRRTSAVEIALANGRVVKVDEGIDPAALAAIVAALDGGAP
jgi:transposase